MDICAFMLAADKYIPDEHAMVYYNNPQSLDGGLRLQADDRQGVAGELLVMDLSKVAPQIEEIILVASIHEAKEKGLYFGKSQQASLSLADTSAHTILKSFELHTGAAPYRSIEFGRLFYRYEKWRFEFLGVGYYEGLERFVEKYVW